MPPEAPAGPGSLCPPPELLKADLLTDSSAVLTWTDVADAYALEVRPAGESFTGQPTHWLQQDPPYQITDLTPGQVYRFRVRAICSPGDTSAWSVARSFQTDLNNARPCPLNLALRDTSCAAPQIFRVHVDGAPGISLGNDVLLRGVRLMVEHPWRSDLGIWLQAPDGMRRQLIGGLNAGDKHIGDPDGLLCSQFVELTDDTLAALPLSAAAETDNMTGYFLPVEAFSGFHNNQDPNGVWLLEICDSKASHTGILRVFSLVFEPGDCAPPEGLNLLAAQDSSATLSWTPVTGSPTLALEYGPAGFHPGADSTAGLGGTVLLLPQPGLPEATLTGLQPLQPYDVYLRRLCAPGLWSGNSVRASFFTSCLPTLLETVDTLALCPTGCADPCPLPGLWQNVPDDDYEWKVRTGPGMAYPTAGPPAAPGGSGNYLYFRNSCTFSGANGKKAILRTRCVLLGAAPTEPCHFSLDLYMNTKIGQMGTLQLQVSNDGGQTWTNIRSWSGNQGKQWRREYVDLSAYDGQVVLLQLVANGVFGAYGDIAVDNLSFYGATPAGTPDFTFFRDADGDGFGDPALRVIACSPDLPPGYSLESGDCDDTDAVIYPGAPEQLCNGVDENCNGLSDDAFILAPVAADVAICQGEPALLSVVGTPLGAYYWFDGSGQVIGSGADLIMPDLTADTVVFVADSLAGACSSQRVPVAVAVHPTPRLEALPEQVLCRGAMLDLAALPWFDSANAGGQLRYYAGFPPEPANELPAPQVSPAADAVYAVVSTTAFGCAGEAMVSVKVVDLPEVQILQGDSMALCKNAAAQLEAAGMGAPPLQFSWSTGLNQAILPFYAGTQSGSSLYRVTLTDGNGCTAADTLTLITLNSIATTGILAVEDVSVCGGNDGSIVLLPLDGTAPFTIAWAGPASGQLSGVSDTTLIPGLTQGGYRVTLTDALGCSMVLPQIVLNAPGLQVVLDSIMHPDCPDATNGCIELAVSGMNPQISWSNGGQGAGICGLGSGSYSATVTDGACQQILQDIALTAPPPVQIILNALEHPACADLPDGSIDLEVFGASPPYAYAWSNGAGEQDLSGLAAGTYQCEITDSRGCLFPTPAYTITAQPPLLIQPDTLIGIDCAGSKSGYIRVEASGGTGALQLAWSNGSNQNAIGSLIAGTYTLTVTDAAGCTAVWSTTLSQPDPLELNLSTMAPTCIGAADGSVQTFAGGGVQPYGWIWNTGDTGSGLSGIAAGAYRVTLTDANGCSKVSPWTSLDAPQLLTLAVDSLAAVPCYGDANGFLRLQLSGAVGAPHILWNGVAGSLVRSGLPGGVYQVGVTDIRGCHINDEFLIPEPAAPLAVSVISVSDALCFGEPNGRIEVATAGGTPGYVYAWSHGAAVEDLMSAPAGTYQLTVTDLNGCTAQTSLLEIAQPPAIEVEPLITDVPCFGPLTGDIDIAVSGGIAPYRFLWSTGDTAQHIYNLLPGTYRLTLVDATGCGIVLDDLVLSTRLERFEIEVLEEVPVSCAGVGDGRIRVRTYNGVSPYQFAWSAPIGLHPNVQAPEDEATGLSGGLYRVTVTDAAGCYTVSPYFQIEEAPPIVLGLDAITLPACKGEAGGSIQALGSGGLPPYAFHWSHGDSTALADSLPAGSYRVTLTDLQGCTREAGPVLITEPAQALQIQLLTLVEDTCGISGGSILQQVSGGVPPWNYLWNTGVTSLNLSGIGAGSYQMTVTDQNGCSRTSPVYTITGNADPLNLSDLVTEAIRCYGDSTGSIAATIGGGAPPYDWLWNNGATGGGLLTGLPAGAYLATVTDQAGCTLTVDAALGQPLEALSVEAAAVWTGADWTVTLTAAGGTAPYAIQWDAAAGGQTGPVATGLPDGVYEATVTDAAGCTVSLQLLPQTLSATPAAAGARIRVFPNPATGRVVVDVPESVVRAELLNAVGQQVPEKLRREGTGLWVLDVSGYAAGVYFLRFHTADGTVAVVRLLKQGDR